MFAHGMISVPVFCYLRYFTIFSLFLTELFLTNLDFDVSGKVLDDRQTNPLISNVSAILSGNKVQGDDLWQANFYGSDTPDGTGPRYNEQVQVFDDIQQDQNFDPNMPLDFRSLRTNFDMSGLTCDQVRFICVEFSRNTESSVDFTILANDDRDFVKCSPIGCESKFETFYSFRHHCLKKRENMKEDEIINFLLMITV